VRKGEIGLMRLRKIFVSLGSLISFIFISMIIIIGLTKGATTLTDGLGRRVTVGRIPQRIVSTVPSNTEILYDLGLKDKVIAVTSHCGKTCDITGKTVIGGWSDQAIVDKIIELEPDLVLAFGGLQSPLATEMEKRNITTFVFFPETVGQTLEQILSVGKLTGTTKAAYGIVNRCRNNLRRIEEKLHDIPAEKRLRALRLMSTEAMVIGGKSFQSDILRRAGAVNIFENIKEAYPIVGLEDVKAKDPDIIIFNRDNEEEAIKWFLEQPGWNELRAAKERRLMSISCDYICHPNTRIDKTVEMLATRFYPERFKTGAGYVHAQDSYPQRIISLAPAATEELYLLGAGDRVVGVTNYCTKPPQALQKERVGTVIEVNLEKIIGLKPDLVIATSLAGLKAVEKLKNLGIKVRTIQQAKDFTQICRQLLQLGDLVGKKKEAEEIVYEAQREVNIIKKKIENLPRASVFIQVGAKPLVTANRSSFINNLVELAGGENIAEGPKDISYMAYSREKVLQADPDYIIIVSMGIAGEEEKRKWESFKNLKAAENKNIYIINAYDICSLTPVGFVDALKEIAGILHPDIELE